MSYQPGDILGGKYKIVEAIGGGAMGMLYKAENTAIQKFVAIKVMQGDFAHNEEYQHRFMREAQAAASLEHFNICTIMDYDVTEKGDAYIVMELLSGEPLSARIKRQGKLDPLSACLIMRQLMCALNCAHSKGIVHRDIKPDNVFLIRNEDRDDFVKLIDFGVAHIEHPKTVDIKPLTQSGQIYGTPQYLSPEQAEGEPIDFRSDLYASGIILYEMLVGKPPFDAKSCLDLLVKQVKEPAPHLPNTNSPYDRLDAIIQKLLAKKPEDRFNSALDVNPLLDEIILILSATPEMQSANFSAISGSLATNLQMMMASHASLAIAPINESKQARTSRLLITLIVVVSLILAGVIAFIGVKNHNKKIAEAQAIAEASRMIERVIGSMEGAEEILTEAEKMALMDDEKDANPEAAEGEVEAVPEEPVIPPPEPYIIDEDFGVASDAVLAENTRLFVASDAFFNSKYATALAILDKVKSDYWNHPNFVRLYLLSAHAAKKTAETHDAFAHLLAIEPRAIFNPAVKEVAEALFDDDENIEALGNAIVDQQGAQSKIAIAWLIIRSDYDHNEQRLNRMIDVYDRLNNVFTSETGEKTETPQWMIRSVNVWRLDKKECQRRLALLTQLEQMKVSKEEVYQNVLIPLSKYDSKECMVSRKRANCNACLREWLEEVVSGYEANAQQADNPAEPAAEPQAEPKADSGKKQPSAQAKDAGSPE